MAFYSRVVWLLLALIVAPLYSSIGEPYKSAFPIVGIVLFVGLTVWVGFLNWRKPDYLLYGAETHFAKWRMEYVPGFGSGKGETPNSGDLLEPALSGVIANHEPAPSSGIFEFDDQNPVVPVRGESHGWAE